LGGKRNLVLCFGLVLGLSVGPLKLVDCGRKLVLGILEVLLGGVPLLLQELELIFEKGLVSVISINQLGVLFLHL
jgi:hypothetical protein